MDCRHNDFTLSLFSEGDSSRQSLRSFAVLVNSLLEHLKNFKRVEGKRATCDLTL